MAKILMVDSDPDVLKLFAEILSMDVETYMISRVSTGEDCLKVLKREASDLILLDIELPDMSGWELVKKIKEFDPGVPVIIATAKPPGVDDFSHLDLVSDYLMKPVTIDGLQMAVRDALEVPALIEKCVEVIRSSGNRFEIKFILEEKYIPLLKDSITSRKRFVLLRQLYTDKKIKNNPEAKIIIDNLSKKLEKANNELKSLKIESKLLFKSY